MTEHKELNEKLDSDLKNARKALAKSSIDIRQLFDLEVNSEIAIMIDYMNSFTQKEDFKSNRFNKYVHYKIRKILEKLINETFNDFLDAYGITLEHFIIISLLSYMKIGYTPDSDNISLLHFFSDIDSIINSYVMEMSINSAIFKNRDKDEAESILKNIKESCEDKMMNDTKFIKNFTAIINKEIENCCIRFINSKRIDKNVNITSENYTLILPNKREAMLILVDLFNVCYIEMERYFSSMVLEQVISFKCKEEFDAKSREFSEMKSEISKQNNEIISLRTNVESLKNEKKRLLNTINDNKKEKELLNEIRELKKELKQKDLDIADLKSHNDSLNEQLNSIISSDDEEISGISKVDTNKKYCFVLCPWPKVMNEIQKEFPNAVFFEKPSSLSDNFDLVIFMSTHLDHITYYAAKNQCRAKNIPYIHCNVTNIDGIKKKIAYAFEKEKDKNE